MRDLANHIDLKRAISPCGGDDRQHGLGIHDR
jgi:hypothetical protein